MRRVAAVVLLCLFGALLPSATVLALAAPQQLLPICCRVHGAHHCMMAAMGGGAAPGSISGAVFRQSGCPYNHGFQAVLSGSVTVESRRGSGLVLAITLFRPLKTSDSLPAISFNSSTPRAPPSSGLSQLSNV